VNNFFDLPTFLDICYTTKEKTKQNHCFEGQMEAMDSIHVSVLVGLLAIKFHSPIPLFIYLNIRKACVFPCPPPPNIQLGLEKTPILSID